MSSDNPSSQSPSTICTLLEGHYHLGFAVLANSLIANGYKGNFHVGYRGELPPWAEPLSETDLEHIKSFNIPGGTSKVFFHLLSTDAHLTNYKPNFMLTAQAYEQSSNIFFFDPDIVVKCSWNYIEKWVGYGVTLCEDVNSPLNLTHPRRLDWKAYYNSLGRKITYLHSEYANGGFVGVSPDTMDFLHTWKDVQTEMAQDIGGLGQSMFTFRTGDRSKSEYTYMFSKSDQDALNVAVAASPQLAFSFAGRDAMDFQPGGYLFAHSLGRNKPWVKNILRSAFKGFPPTPTDKVFWNYANGPIKAFASTLPAKKKRHLKIAQAISRFYKR